MSASDKEPSLKLAKLNQQPEIFHSLQGEGINQGVPSIFIRSSLCNLHCRWCDTDYTWNWEGTPWPHERDSEPGYQKFSRENYIVEMSIGEIVKLLTRIPCHNIILTGGEPLLQDTAWLALMTRLTGLHNHASQPPPPPHARQPRYRFEVETNGTLVPSEGFDAAVHQYNVSPKLNNSGNEDHLRLRDNALAFFASSHKSWFKFVIAETSDLAEIEQLIARHHLPKERILLMPEGRDEFTLQSRRLWLADLCRDRGYRYSDRLHIQLWGSKRGV